MRAVTPEQFQHVSDLEVLHRPTGTNVSTYRYTNPVDACSSIHVNFGKADDDYDRMEIIRVACELLCESARR
jgi:hypothetical protein